MNNDITVNGEELKEYVIQKEVEEELEHSKNKHFFYKKQSAQEVLDKSKNGKVHIMSERQKRKFEAKEELHKNDRNRDQHMISCLLLASYNVKQLTEILNEHGHKTSKHAINFAITKKLMGTELGKYLEKVKSPGEKAVYYHLPCNELTVNKAYNLFAQKLKTNNFERYEPKKDKKEVKVSGNNDTNEIINNAIEKGRRVVIETGNMKITIN